MPAKKQEKTSLALIGLLGLVIVGAVLVNFSGNGSQLQGSFDPDKFTFEGEIHQALVDGEDFLITDGRPWPALLCSHLAYEGFEGVQFGVTLEKDLTAREVVEAIKNNWNNYCPGLDLSFSTQGANIFELPL